MPAPLHHTLVTFCLAVWYFGAVSVGKPADREPLPLTMWEVVLSDFRSVAELLGEHRYEQATKRLDELAQSLPFGYGTHAARVERELRNILSNRERARAHSNSTHSDRYDEARLLRDAARICMQLGCYEPAAELLAEAIALPPRPGLETDVRNRLYCCLLRGDFAASRLAELSRQATPGAATWPGLREWRSERDDWQQAKAHLTEANSQLHHGMEGGWWSTLVELQRTRSLVTEQQQQVEWHEALLEQLRRIEDVPGLIASQERLADQFADRADMPHRLMKLGAAAMIAMPAAAAAAYRIVVDKYPNFESHPYAWLELGSALERDHQLPEALDTYKKLVADIDGRHRRGLSEKDGYCYSGAAEGIGEILDSQNDIPHALEYVLQSHRYWCGTGCGTCDQELEMAHAAFVARLTAKLRAAE